MDAADGLDLRLFFDELNVSSGCWWMLMMGGWMLIVTQWWVNEC